MALGTSEVPLVISVPANLHFWYESDRLVRHHLETDFGEKLVDEEHYRSIFESLKQVKTLHC